MYPLGHKLVMIMYDVYKSHLECHRFKLKKKKLKKKHCRSINTHFRKLSCSSIPAGDYNCFGYNKNEIK